MNGHGDCEVSGAGLSGSVSLEDDFCEAGMRPSAENKEQEV